MPYFDSARVEISCSSSKRRKSSSRFFCFSSSKSAIKSNYILNDIIYIMQRTKGKPKLLVLLDAHAIIHRAYHALPEFLSSSGEPTGALYGLATMLMRIITELKPDYIVACYDLPGKTFRHEAYDGYKAKRVKADDALVAQLKNSREIFEAFGIPIYDAPGFEADDVIGTIVQKLKIKNSKLKIIIASGDMDTMQLVDNKKVQVYTLKKGLSDTIL